MGCRGQATARRGELARLTALGVPAATEDRALDLPTGLSTEAPLSSH